MAQSQTTKTKVEVGRPFEVPEGAEVRRPDGTVSKSTGGSYIADVPGTFTVGDTEYVTK